MPFFCYILECSDGTFYTGWTTDPKRRLRQHNTGRGARYTRTHGPVKLVYVEECEDRRAAMKRELAIKRLPRLRKKKLIGEEGPLNTRDTKGHEGKHVGNTHQPLPGTAAGAVVVSTDATVTTNKKLKRAPRRRVLRGK